MHCACVFAATFAQDCWQVAAALVFTCEEKKSHAASDATIPSKHAMRRVTEPPPHFACSDPVDLSPFSQVVPGLEIVNQSGFRRLPAHELARNGAGGRRIAPEQRAYPSEMRNGVSCGDRRDRNI